MEQEHLHLLIHEEIFQLPEDGNVDEANAVDTEKEITDEPETVNEPEQKLEATKEKADKPLAESEVEPESPEIPIQEVEEPEEIPFAVFHSSTDISDRELLQKIIDACKLPKDEYKIFGNGFDRSVQFKKALVFVPEAKAFYTPIPYKESQFLCSKPLDQISGDVNEKAKLWGALQKFVL